MTARLRSIGDAAEELGVSKDHVRRLVSRGLRAVRLGKRLLIPQVEIDRLVVHGLQQAPKGQPALAKGKAKS
jgi:excisionase family DNA binding protein